MKYSSKYELVIKKLLAQHMEIKELNRLASPKYENQSIRGRKMFRTDLKRSCEHKMQDYHPDGVCTKLH